MPVTLDDNLDHSAGFLTLSPAAAWLWLEGMLYASRHLTDGILPMSALGGFPQFIDYDKRGLGRLVRELITAGRLKKEGKSLLLIDYHESQPFAADVIRLQRQRTAAGRLGGLASGRGKQASAIASAEASAIASAEAVAVRNRTASAQASAGSEVEKPPPGARADLVPSTRSSTSTGTRSTSAPSAEAAAAEDGSVLGPDGPISSSISTKKKEKKAVVLISFREVRGIAKQIRDRFVKGGRPLTLVDLSEAVKQACAEDKIAHDPETIEKALGDVASQAAHQAMD